MQLFLVVLWLLIRGIFFSVFNIHALVTLPCFSFSICAHAQCPYIDAALAFPGGDHTQQRSDDVTSSKPSARLRRALPFHPFHGLGGPFSAQNVFLLREMSRRRPDFIGKRSQSHYSQPPDSAALHSMYARLVSRNNFPNLLPLYHQNQQHSAATTPMLRSRRYAEAISPMAAAELSVASTTKRLSPFIVGKRAPPSFIGKRQDGDEDEKRARFFVGRRSHPDDSADDDVDDLEGDLVKRARFFVGKKDAEDDKRARMFVGKRARMFVGKREHDEDMEDEKRARMFVGKRPRMFVGKRAHMFVGKRAYDEDWDDKRARMFVGKRAHMFVGKRDGLEDLDDEEKRARMFIGKRADDSEEEKRNRMFVGKRRNLFIGKRADEEDGKRARMFVGKRAHMFVGKRADDLEEEEKRARMFVGKRAHMFVGKRADDLDDLEEEEKRNRMFVGKRARMFVGRRSQSEDDKRARMFVGKRSDDELDFDKRAHMFMGRNFQIPQDYYDPLKRARFFVGKRDDDEEDDFELEEEKRNRMFVGKRRVPGFVGKRPAPGFIGKRDTSDQLAATAGEHIVKRSLLSTNTKVSTAETADNVVKRDTSSLIAKDSPSDGDVLSKSHSK